MLICVFQWNTLVIIKISTNATINLIHDNPGILCLHLCKENGNYLNLCKFVVKFEHTKYKYKKDYKNQKSNKEEIQGRIQHPLRLVMLHFRGSAASCEA